MIEALSGVQNSAYSICNNQGGGCATYVGEALLFLFGLFFIIIFVTYSIFVKENFVGDRIL